MSRIACVVVPRLSVAALLRAEPELRGCPLVVCEAPARTRQHAPDPRSVLVEISQEAERLGLRVGMTLAQALIHHADLVARPLDETTIAAAREALADVASSISPRVEVDGNAVYLDVEGLTAIFPSEGGVAAALSTRAERVGLEAGIGIAASKATARIAAGLAARRKEVILVPPGEDVAWLASKPLSILSAVAEPAKRGRAARSSWPALRESFARLGLRTLGDLARLPRQEVGSRFGPAGARLWRVAIGEEKAPLLPAPPKPEFTEGVRLEYAVESLEALLFVMRGILDRLLRRLAIHGLSCGGLRLTLDLAGGGHVERRVGILAPTSDVKTLAVLSRHTLEVEPPRDAVVGIRAIARGDRPRPQQLDLFRPSGPSPERLATTLVRLSALCGAGRIGRPVPAAGYRSEAFLLRPFEPTTEQGSAEEIDLQPAPPRSGRVALRLLRPPRRAQVFQDGGRIAYVRAPGLGGRAVASGGPWRIEAEWWTEPPCRRDYYDVQLSDGGLYRLYRELGRGGFAPGRWFVEGYYD